MCIYIYIYTHTHTHILRPFHLAAIHAVRSIREPRTGISGLCLSYILSVKGRHSWAQRNFPEIQAQRYSVCRFSVCELTVRIPGSIDSWTPLSGGDFSPSKERGCVVSVSVRAKYYTPDVTNMNIRWKIPLTVHWKMPLKSTMISEVLISGVQSFAPKACFLENISFKQHVSSSKIALHQLSIYHLAISTLQIPSKVRPIPLLTLWISEGLTQTQS